MHCFHLNTRVVRFETELRKKSLKIKAEKDFNEFAFICHL